jgi:hypothetical protein
MLNLFYYYSIYVHFNRHELSVAEQIRACVASMVRLSAEKERSTAAEEVWISITERAKCTVRIREAAAADQTRQIRAKRTERYSSVVSGTPILRDRKSRLRYRRRRCRSAKFTSAGQAARSCTNQS